MSISLAKGANISLSKEELAVVFTIHDADLRRQNFGMVQNAFMRIVNEVTGREISRYDLTGLFD